MQHAAARAGMPVAVSAHWLRRAHASHALDHGAPIHLVQATAGPRQCGHHGDGATHDWMVQELVAEVNYAASHQLAEPCFCRQAQGDELGATGKLGL
jgi:hypothetical protein